MFELGIKTEEDCLPYLSFYSERRHSMSETASKSHNDPA